MRWDGRRYRPSATAHFERLTGAGDGWYFFPRQRRQLPHVPDRRPRLGGVPEVRQDRGRGSHPQYDAELNTYFDYYGAQYGAATRFWPVYAAPAPFASEPAAESVADDDEPVILE
jgi:hypothetical protein